MADIVKILPGHCTRSTELLLTALGMSERPPSFLDQHEYDDLPRLSEERLHVRRESVFLILAGIFLGTLTMLNILGATRFVDLSLPLWGDRYIPMEVPIGILPYPITFLCTDFISELYGRRRANLLVFVGLFLNLWVVFIFWLGGTLPKAAPFSDQVFQDLRGYIAPSVIASMVAYMAAQFIDVYLFHFWKRLTKGRHLWLRNNASTMVSQFVDTAAVLLLLHFQAGKLQLDPNKGEFAQLASLIGQAYIFKLIVAALDTIPFYLGARGLSRYLRFPPPEHEFEPSGGVRA